MADWARRTRHPDAPEPTAGPGPHLPRHRIAQLQRQVGNRVVAEYVQALAVQRIKEGDGPSPDVGVIQQQLNAVGATPKLAITGRFDAATTTATKVFQKKLIADGLAGVVEDGIVDGITHLQLKARAPSVKVSATDTVVIGPGNTQVPSNPAAGTHKQLQAGAKGVAVKELQERLNNSGTAGKKLVVDGIFGPRTDAGLKAFQAAVPIGATGIADPATWAKLETAGAATQGHAEFDWTEEVEGVKGVGLRASYDWKLSKTALTITVGITFQKKQKNVDSAITRWLADIKEIWSTFKAVNTSDPKKKEMNLNFEAKPGGGDHTVEVFQYNPKYTKKQDRPKSRSDSSHWYAIDKRRSLAPHEFGHLIGLADEYNRTEEHYRDVTGEEPAVGDPAGVAADATKLAGDIKAKLPLDDAPPAPVKAENDERWGANLAAVITPKLGRKQGGFSRFVGQEYSKANAGASVYADIQQAFSTKSVPGFQDNLTACVTPFLYSDKGLMGKMLTTPAKGGGGKDAPEHEHPIEPRHVQPFVNLLAKEWAMQTGKADIWKPERR